MNVRKRNGTLEPIKLEKILKAVTRSAKGISDVDPVLTVLDLATMLRIHPVTVRLKAAAGEIPGRQIGNRWRFSRPRIEAWLSEDEG